MSIPTTSPSTARRGLVVVVLATALIVVDTTVMGVAVDAIGRDWTVGLDTVQWVVVGYAVTFAAVILPTGSLSDRLGHRRLFSSGVLVFTLASLGCALAWDILALNIFRTVQGVGAGIIFATAVPLVVATNTPESRPKALALWSAAAGSASALGPVLGGVLVSVADWHAIFAINLPFGVATLILARRWLPPDPPREISGVTAAELVTTAALIAALLCVFYVLDTARQEWTPLKVTLGVGGAGLLAATLAVQRRLPRPLVDMTLTRSRRYSGAATLSMLSRFTTMAAPVFLVIYFQQGLGAGPLDAGLRLAPMFLAAFFGGLLSGRLQSRIAVSHIVAAGFAIAAAGALWTAAIIGPATGTAALTVSLLPVGLGFGLASTPLIAVAVSTVTPDRAGMASGLANSVIPLGTASGTAILGLVFSTNDPQAPAELAAAAGDVMITAGAVGIAATVLAAWSLRTRAPHQEAAPAAAGDPGAAKGDTR
ncbi:MFS transporter [Nocardia sp. CNY236]|uniref:MFS transporter n=1 Tax=Nocardia sp. CNY236 TaxID=1169152 RepID=UPI0004042C44|nr:MFS transporter [Nocardia sp. CNY236]